VRVGELVRKIWGASRLERHVVRIHRWDAQVVQCEIRQVRL
jgi:hypothetical protein